MTCSKHELLQHLRIHVVIPINFDRFDLRWKRLSSELIGRFDNSLNAIHTDTDRHRKTFDDSVIFVRELISLDSILQKRYFRCSQILDQNLAQVDAGLLRVMYDSICCVVTVWCQKSLL